MPMIQAAGPVASPLRRLADRAVAVLLLTILCVALPSSGAWAQGQALRMSAPFEAGRLTRGELRILQAALALEGEYEALVDGAWGRSSQDALAAHVGQANAGQRPTWRDIRDLLRRFEAERRGGGWRPVWHDAGQIWHLRPDGTLGDRSTESEERYVSEDGALMVIAQANAVRPDALHADFASDARSGSDPYQLNGSDRIVTAAEMRGGRFAYVRSDRARNGFDWTTHIVIADAANRQRLRLIASSFAREQQADIDIAPGTVLAALLDSAPALSDTDGISRGETAREPVEDALGTILNDALTRLLDGEDAVPREAPSDRFDDPEIASGADRLLALDRQVRRSGSLTGSYVNTTDILTADTLEARCDGAVLLERGTPLTLLTRDAELGLAIYAAPGRSDSWIPISLGVPGDGLPVTVASRTERDGLRSREGSVTTGRDTGGLRLSFDPDRQGDAGAALLGPDLAMVGLWTGDAGTRSGRRGEAIGASQMVAFLDAARIPFGTPSQRLRPGDRLADTVGDAIVELRCDPG